MSFQSIDKLQRTLADSVFRYADDRKKAAGRALGTLVEIVTFYTLRSWSLSHHMVIERRIPEFANPEIVHNVEFSLHHIDSRYGLDLGTPPLPLTAAKLKRHFSFLGAHSLKSVTVLSRDYLKRNATLLTETNVGPIIANVDAFGHSHCDVAVCQLAPDPFAMFECKRVGVEEGMKKGPQTIEKAKQGAYVARTVSSLQKVRLRSGEFQGVIEEADGEFRTGSYLDLLNEIVNSPYRALPPGFVLTVGVVSNHGNWFTSGDQNKELRVLAQSYDWLLFLTDDGLAKFIEDALLDPKPALEPASRAFLASYSGKRRQNRFTKVRMDAHADYALQRYFADNKAAVESWFNVISPHKGSLPTLRADLKRLSKKPPTAVTGI